MLLMILGRMGSSDDKFAVVDSRARVYGVTGLRVVDASAFPFIPPGYPMSTVCMSSEHLQFPTC
jgi:choline dehydrogenase